MKTRRYSITKDNAELIIIALEILINELEKELNNLTPRELNQLAEMKMLKTNLENYQWYI